MEIVKGYPKDHIEQTCSQELEPVKPRVTIIEKEQGILYTISDAFRALNPIETVQSMQKIVRDVTETFSIKEGTALCELKRNGWDLDETMNNIADNSGDLESPQPDETFKEFECPVCYTTETREHASSFGCNHFYCKDCLKEYIRVAIHEDQPLKTCPTEDCKEVLTPEICSQYFRDEPEIFDKYKRFLVKTIVENSHNFLWCTGTECNNVIQLLKMKKNENITLNIRCTCEHHFCLSCKDVAHRPLTCDQFVEWKAKIAKDEEQLLNIAWMQKNSKPCPQCQVNIEKNNGCKHMTCMKCRHQFCWNCLSNWSTHSEYCPQINPIDRRLFQSQKKKNFEAEIFKYEQNALQDTMKKKKIILENFRSLNSQVQSSKDEKFLIETLDIIYDARIAISMTYAVGYFRKSVGLPTDEHEFMQSLLWETLESLEKLTDPLQSKEEMEEILVTYDQEKMLFSDKFHDFVCNLDEKTKEVITTCNNILIEMEKESSLFVFMEKDQDKYHLDEDWHCADCGHYNLKHYKLCEACFITKSVFGDDISYF